MYLFLVGVICYCPNCKLIKKLLHFRSRLDQLQRKLFSRLADMCCLPSYFCALQMTYWKNFARVQLASKFINIYLVLQLFATTCFFPRCQKGMNWCKFVMLTPVNAPIKCCVIVYNETKYEFIRSNRVWQFGNNQVQEDGNYKHLGVINNKYLSFKPNINDATDKLKGTFFSLINNGIFYEDSFHPLTCKKIYNAVVIPKTLYGCENWSALTSAELLTLGRAHRFCFKRMQPLNMHTRTDIALGLLAMFPLEVEIDI